MTAILKFLNFQDFNICPIEISVSVTTIHVLQWIDQFWQNFPLATTLATMVAILNFSNFQEFCERVGDFCFTKSLLSWFETYIHEKVLQSFFLNLVLFTNLFVFYSSSTWYIYFFHQELLIMKLEHYVSLPLLFFCFQAWLLEGELWLWCYWDTGFGGGRYWSQDVQCWLLPSKWTFSNRNGCYQKRHVCQAKETIQC